MAIDMMHTTATPDQGVVPSVQTADTIQEKSTY